MTKEEREDAINCFKNKIENEVYGSKYNKLALEALEQAPILDKIRAEMFEEMLSHSGTGEEVIQAYADGLKKGLQIIDKYRTEVEITPQFSSGLDKNSKELEKDFGESDCIIRDSAIKALDYDIKCFEFKPGVSKHMDDIAKLLNTIYETQVNNIKTLPSVPQEPILEKINKMKSEIADSLEFWDYSPNNNPLARDMLETITNFWGDLQDGKID